MFLFPDAGRAAYPGAFRAESIRAVYADWNGGELSKYFEDFPLSGTGAGGQPGREFLGPQARKWLDLPVDYYVLRRANALERIRPCIVHASMSCMTDTI